MESGLFHFKQQTVALKMQTTGGRFVICSHFLDEDIVWNPATTRSSILVFLSLFANTGKNTIFCPCLLLGGLTSSVISRIEASVQKSPSADRSS